MTPQFVRKIKKISELAVSRVSLKFGFESDSLIILYLHGVFASLREKNTATNLILSYDGITLDGLRKVIRYFVVLGYTFISPVDFMNGLNCDKKYVMLTFDDGYASNIIVAGLLNECKVPGVFFISPGYVINDKSFWWDVVFRELHKRSYGFNYIVACIQNLKNFRADEIEEVLLSKFGLKALYPVSELDRPFRVNELKKFSREPYVFIGNHTMDHAILTNYSAYDAKMQIINAQDILNDVVQCNLPIISYPSGAYSNEIVRICTDLKFILGFTVKPEKIQTCQACSGGSLLELGRFSLKSNDANVLHNCEIARADIVLSNICNYVYKNITTYLYCNIFY